MSEHVSKLSALAFTLTDANTWYRIDLPPGTSRVRVQPRGDTDVRVRFDRGAVATPAAAPAAADADAYWSLTKEPGAYIDQKLTSGAGPRTLYCASPQAATVVEILIGI